MPTLIWLTTNSFYANQSDYIFPNLNFAVFERIFSKFPPTFLSPWFSIWENTHPSRRSYRKINLDLAGNVILDENQQENNVKDRNFVLSVLDWVTNHRTKLSYTETYLKIIVRWLLMISVPLVQATWLTPTYPMKRIYFRHWYTWTIRRQSNLDASIRFVLWQNWEYETRNPNGSAAVVRYRSNIGTAVTYGFETMFDWNLNRTFWTKENFIWMSSLTLP
jgi:Fe(3+) dicitrate transport protein